MEIKVLSGGSYLSGIEYIQETRGDSEEGGVHKATIYGLISVAGRSCTSNDCICCLSGPSSYLGV